MRAGGRTRVIRITAGRAVSDAAGGKARGLERIATAGLPLPDSWCLLAGATDAEIAELGRELDRRGHHLLAVRSSAQDEDREQASFAGIHASRLGVRGAELAAAVREVAASSLTPRAQAYREQLGLPPATEPCAVVVQPLVPGECAGVAFGIDGDGPSVVIEGVRGLGETLVEGRAVPESVRLCRNEHGWTLEGRRPGRQIEALLLKDDQLHRVPLPAGQAKVDVLSSALSAKIAAGVAALERQEGRRLDVEWVSHGGAVHFLQARPQTRPLSEELPSGEVWTRVNLREVLPDIPSAFSRSLLLGALDDAVRAVVLSYGLTPKPNVPYATTVCGRAVFNERVFTVPDIMGVPREGLQANLGGTAWPSPRPARSSFRRALAHPVILVRALRVGATIERRVAQVTERNHALRKRLDAVHLDSVSPTYLEGELPAALKAARDSARDAQYLAGALLGAQDQALAILDRLASPGSLLSRLVAGGEPTVSTRQLEDLLDVAGAMRRAGVEGFVRDVTPDHARREYWWARLPEGLRGAIQTWLQRYGHRGPWESDVAYPRYGDDLRVFAEILFPLVRAKEPPETAAESRARRQGEADEAWRTAREELGRLALWRLEGLVAQMKRLMKLREQLRSSFVGWLQPHRRILLTLGRLLAKAGRLRNPEDLWHLGFDEIVRAFEDDSFRPDVAVARERARRAAWGRLDVPNRFTSEEVHGFSTARWRGSDAGPVHHGNGISPGAVEGRVCVLLSPQDGDRLETGAVLVAPATDPAWTPLFARASGVVVELGGMLSHSGIVAREYGIPCVANVRDATRLLRHGDRIHVDGTSGTVRLIQRVGSLGSEGGGSGADDARAPAEGEA